TSTIWLVTFQVPVITNHLHSNNYKSNLTVLSPTVKTFIHKDVNISINLAVHAGDIVTKTAKN
ncbi:hypothetical protein ACJX0J_017206, partial [Zea mays]